MPRECEFARDAMRRLPGPTGKRFSTDGARRPGADSAPIITIESLEQEARGVGRWQGKTIFVDGALAGGSCRVLAVPT